MYFTQARAEEELLQQLVTTRRRVAKLSYRLLHCLEGPQHKTSGAGRLSGDPITKHSEGVKDQSPTSADPLVSMRCALLKSDDEACTLTLDSNRDLVMHTSTSLLHTLAAEVVLSGLSDKPIPKTATGAPLALKCNLTECDIELSSLALIVNVPSKLLERISGDSLQSQYLHARSSTVRFNVSSFSCIGLLLCRGVCQNIGMHGPKCSSRPREGDEDSTGNYTTHCRGSS